MISGYVHVIRALTLKVGYIIIAFCTNHYLHKYTASSMRGSPCVQLDYLAISSYKLRLVAVLFSQYSVSITQLVNN